VADALLMLILLINDGWWTSLTRVRRTVPRGAWVGAVVSLGVKIGLL
jgi:hypothetical protein